MSFSPDAWKRLGILFQDARHRLGASRKTFADLAGISEKAVYNAESGDPHNTIPPTFTKYAAAIDWAPGSVQAVLEGGAPKTTRQTEAASPPRPAVLPQERTLLDLLGRVHEFGRLAVRLGASPALRDELDTVAQQLVQSIPRDTDDTAHLIDTPAGDEAERLLEAFERESDD